MKNVLETLEKLNKADDMLYLEKETGDIYSDEKLLKIFTKEYVEKIKTDPLFYLDVSMKSYRDIRLTEYIPLLVFIDDIKNMLQMSKNENLDFFEEGDDN